MTDSTPKGAPPPRKTRGMTALGTLVPPAVGPVFSKRGFAGADVAVHWPEIVGVGVARFSRPLNLVWPRGGAEQGLGATLIVACAPAFALDLQQMAPVIMERLNRRLGWRCVSRLTLKQMPVRPPQPPVTRPSPDGDDRAAAGRIVAGIAADELREALTRLGAGAIARARRSRNRA